MSVIRKSHSYSESFPSFKLGNGPIFVVDDDLDQIMIIDRCYAASDRTNKLELFKTGKELLQALKEVVAGHAPFPELILLDINMPEMDGFDTLKYIRDCPEFKRIPVIIMLTSSNSHADMEKSFSLGADGFWTKPTSIRDYIDFFSRT